MTKMQNQMTKHHVIPKSKWGTNHWANLKTWKRKPHQAFHIIFENLAPHEQLKYILDLSVNVIKEEFREELLDIIDGYKLKDIYVKECVSVQKMAREILDNK